MQVILLEKVVNLGALGDVVKVKDGFARNYLLPKGKAKRATPENLAEFEKKRGDLERVQSATLDAAQEKGAKLEGLTIQITQKAGVDGRLFGSVTTFDIVEALEDPPAARAAQDRGRPRHRDRAAHRRAGPRQDIGAGGNPAAVTSASR